MDEAILNKNCFDAMEGMDQVSIKKWLRDNKDSIVIIGPEKNNKSLTCFTRTTLRSWAEDENYVVNNEDQPGEQAFRLTTIGEGSCYYIWYEEIVSQAIKNRRARIFEITPFDESAVRFSWNQQNLKVYSLVPVKVSDLDMLLNRSDEIQEENLEKEELKEEEKQIVPSHSHIYAIPGEQIAEGNCFDINNANKTTVREWLGKSNQNIIIIDPLGKVTCYTKEKLLDAAAPRNHIRESGSKRIIFPLRTVSQTWYISIESEDNYSSFRQVLQDSELRVIDVAGRIGMYAGYETWHLYERVDAANIPKAPASSLDQEIIEGNCFDVNNSNKVTTVVAWLEKSNQNIIIVDPLGKITCFTRKKLLDAIAPRNHIHVPRSKRIIYPLKTASQTWYITNDDDYDHFSFEDLHLRVWLIHGPSHGYAGYKTWTLTERHNVEVKKSPESPEEEEESQLTDIVANGNCFGWISLENLNIRNWLKHNPDAIIVIFPDNSITCYLKDKLNDMMKDPTYGFYQCRGKDYIGEYERKRALKLPSGNGDNYHVWAKEIEQYLSNSNASRILKFDVEKQIARWNFSISAAMIDEFGRIFHWRNPASSRIGSSWKCQEGTEINVYHITPKSVKAIEQIIHGRRD
jgi:hypothetical protein